MSEARQELRLLAFEMADKLELCGIGHIDRHQFDLALMSRTVSSCRLGRTSLGVDDMSEALTASMGRPLTWEEFAIVVYMMSDSEEPDPLLEEAI